MKKLFLFAVAIALTLASCSNDKELNFPVEKNTDGSIEFRTLTDKGRAAITNESNILSFTVTGIKMKESATPGTFDTPDGYLFNAFGITRGEKSTWDYTPKRYWPEGNKINFYAYSPSSSRNIKDGEGITDYTDAKSITYTVPQIEESNAQEDFLVARLTNQDKNTGAVKLNFHHTLSRIMFFAKTTQKNITYTIEKVELLNLKTTGKLNLNDAAIKETGALDYSTPLVVWTAQSDPEKYTVDMGASPIYLLNDYASILGKTGAMLVMPQPTTISSKGTGKEEPATGEFAIAVSYRAFVDDVDYAGSEGNPVVKYFAVEDPASAGSGLTFEMGRQYNFYLGFGEDVNGEIKFEVGVSDWNDTPGVFIPELDNYAGIISNDLAKIANSSFDATSNPNVKLAQIEAITSLQLSNKTSFDFTGIEHFKKMTSITLDNVKGGNDLDASKNIALKTVTIKNGSVLGNVNLSNSILTTLAFEGSNTVASLNASNNKLTSVTFSSTPKIDGSLNLSGNTTLTTINLTGVEYIASKTFNLDLSNCGLTGVTLSSTKISDLNLSNNQLVTLDVTSSTFQNLDISNNKLLTIVNFDKSSVKTGTGTGLLNAKGNAALTKFLTGAEATSNNAYVIDNFDIQDSKEITKIDVMKSYTINTLTVWDGCTYAYLTASPAFILNRHSSGSLYGYVNNIKTADGTVII
ncbi:fimbrillin family protein [Paludibacteraceae bacterium OttesenSCG-928-F17]|nr:fimbrillin family protein [Paludibacteraceae bacterium OttesenSCG-928-F17]